MPLDFPSSPTNGQVVELGGLKYIYRTSSTTWDLHDGLFETYATLSDLPSSATDGDLAFVTANKIFYAWSNSKWGGIQLANATPTWSAEPNDVYYLEQDGTTTTTVSISAADPELLNQFITYSHVNNGNSNKVTSIVNNNNGTFTITPTSVTANMLPDFTITFSATDGLNTVSKTSTFFGFFSTTLTSFFSSFILSAESRVKIVSPLLTLSPIDTFIFSILPE